MEPIHTIEYELTTDFATEVRRTIVRWELRRSWRRDLPVFAGALVFATLIIGLSLQGWILPAFGGALLCVIVFFAFGAIVRRWSLARGGSLIALLPLHTTDRRVRIEFHADNVRLETEYFRGEGAWTELDEIVVFSTCWLLYLSNGGQILVPSSRLSSELENFLRTKAQEVTAPIRQL
jgi:hypothetical protein